MFSKGCENKVLVDGSTTLQRPDLVRRKLTLFVIAGRYRISILDTRFSLLDKSWRLIHPVSRSQNLASVIQPEWWNCD